MKSKLILSAVLLFLLLVSCYTAKQYSATHEKICFQGKVLITINAQFNNAVAFWDIDNNGKPIKCDSLFVR